MRVGGGGCRRHISSPRATAALRILGGGSIAASPSRTKAKGRESAGECRRRTLCPVDRRAANIGGRIDPASPSPMEATGRGSAGRMPEPHPPTGRPPRREYWVEDCRRRLPPGQRPRDEGQRGEYWRRTLNRDVRCAANICRRFDHGVSLPDGGQGKRVGGGSAGGATSPQPTAAPRMLGGGSIVASPSRTEARGQWSAGGGPEAHPPPSHPPRHKYWGEDRRRHPPP